MPALTSDETHEVRRYASDAGNGADITLNRVRKAGETDGRRAELGEMYDADKFFAKCP